MCKYVVSREVPAGKDAKTQKPSFKRPKVQRLVTPARLQHKRQVKALKRKRSEATRALAEEYNTLLAKRVKEAAAATKAAKDAKRKKSSLHAAKLSQKA